MNSNPVTMLITFVFFFPILKGFLSKFSSKDLKDDIEETTKSIMLLVSLFLGAYFVKKLLIDHDSGIFKFLYEKMPINILNYINMNKYIYILLVPIFIIIIYKILNLILNLINSITIYPVLDLLERLLNNRSNFIKRIFGAFFSVPKAVCYTISIAFILNILSIIVSHTNNLNAYLATSKPYNVICKQLIIPVTNSSIARKLPNVINNSFKVVIKQSKDNIDINPNNSLGKTIVYYNGVTLDEGIKSNQEINKLSRYIVRNETNSKDKSRRIYKYIGQNISYDYDKAEQVLKNNYESPSGAIPAFNRKKGICFDYACLYVAMCRAANLKVRIITGEGFNGVSWVNHAWNQVYITEENKWINVDSTFYKGGDYFDSRRFELDHRKSEIIGEW